MVDAMKEQAAMKGGRGRRFFGIYGAGVIALGLVLFSGCTPEPVATPATLCELRDSNTRFLCDVTAREAPADCRPEIIGSATRRRFLHQMTTVSLELLHLDTGPGAQGPFAYNDTAAVLAAVRVELCRVRGQSCTCRMSYRRSRLGDLIQDAAACQSSSPFSDDPLYFRARGCR